MEEVLKKLEAMQAELTDLRKSADARQPYYTRAGAPGRNRRDANAQVICYYCGKPGHFQRDCIVKRRDEERADGQRYPATAPPDRQRYPPNAPPDRQRYPSNGPPPPSNYPGRQDGPPRPANQQ
ncbi:uncharacterized protein LOC135488555 [Lineus longissimus]|uniref:uncharacterized protein LOC135488555 n=1 Tax=Lineus longissimus TaxID=88925 RepID=UPI00315DFB57